MRRAFFGGVAHLGPPLPTAHDEVAAEQEKAHHGDGTAGEFAPKQAGEHFRVPVAVAQLSAVLGERLCVAGGAAGPLSSGGRLFGAPPPAPGPLPRPLAGRGPGSSPAGLAMKVFHW